MRSPHRGQRAVVATVAAFATLATLLVSAPAAYAEPTAARTGKVKASEQLKAADTATSTVPTPPSDIVGRPAASVVVRTDGLMINKTGTDGAMTSRWAKLKSDLSDYGDQGSAGSQQLRQPVEPTVITRSARLLDPQSERVLSLQHSAAGTDSLWQVSALNPAAEPGWHDKDTTGRVTPDAGGTYVLSLVSGDAVSERLGSEDFFEQMDTQAKDVNSARQQWSLQADPDHAGYFRLISRSDGMCINVLSGSTADNTPVGAWPCTEAASYASNEVWKPTPVPGDPGMYTFTSLSSGKLLTRLTNGSGLVQLPASTAFKATQSWNLTQINEPGGTIPTWSTPASVQPGLPRALATGDLDRSVNAAGQYGDEAVVAYVGDDHQLQLRVLDYNADDSHLLVTPAAGMPSVGATVDGTWYPGSVGVAIGDFDGDLMNEIAVTWQDSKGFHATILRYAADGAARSLKVVRPDVPLYADDSVTPSLVTGLADTVAGDFDGDRSDDLGMAFAAPDGNGRLVVWAGVTTFTGSDTVAAHDVSAVSGANATVALIVPAGNATWAARRVQAVSGLFRMDSGSGHTMSRRQLAVVWTDDVQQPSTRHFAYTRTAVLDVSRTADTTVLSISKIGSEVVGYSTDAGAARTLPVSVTAGGFAGRGSGSSIPTWGLAVGGAFSDPDGEEDDTAYPAVLLVGVNGNGAPAQISYHREGDPGTEVSVQAYDRSGTSIVLGAPVVMTVNQLVKANLIAAQPPAHSDWLWTGKQYEFVNVSRNPDFSVKLGSGTETNYTFSHTTKASSTLGVSEGFDSTTSVEEGLFGIGKLGGSIEVAQKFGEDWESDQADTSKYSTTFSRTETTTGSDDDIIDALMVNNTVYRYPILGGALTTTDGTPVTTPNCSSNCYGYYEVTIPGAVTPIHSFGRADAWYQPSWQNGNALSYPQLDGGRVSTPDVGDYSYVDDNGTTQTKSGTLFNETNVLGGGSTAYDLELDSSVGGAHDRTSGGSMKNSQELTAGMDVSFSVGVAKGSEKVDVSAGVEEGSTWATTDTGDTESKTSTSFALDVPAVRENMGYEVGTAYYTDTAGTQKVVHGVNLTASDQGNEWWLDNYGRSPDLALNLPLSTVMTKNDLGVYDDPKWSPENNRQRIRGFWAEQPVDPSSPLTSGVPYATNPKAGDPVVFAVQVHNYSLKAAGSSTAKFYAVPVDELGLDVTGDPQLIGTTATPAMDPQGMATIYSPKWSAVGPTGGTGLQNYRIFVVLDPDNTLNEIHPLNGQPACPAEDVEDGSVLTDPMTGDAETLSCGQNNQGYGEVAVMSGGLQGNRQNGELSLAGSSIMTGGDLLSSPEQGGTPKLVVGQLVHGIVHASASANNDDIAQVFVYDGKPESGQLIAHSKLSGADAVNGGYADFSWQPTTAGRHVLYEVLSTAGGQEQVQKVVVRVKAHGAATQLRVAPAASSVPAGSPAEVRVVTADRWGNEVKDVTAKAALTISPDGSCTIGSCQATTVGPHTVTAGYRHWSDTTDLTITAAPAQLEPTSGAAQSARSGRTFGRPLVTTVTDSLGKPVPNAVVTFTVSKGSPRFANGSASVSVTGDADGRVTAPALTAGAATGPALVTATTGRVSTSFPLSVAAGGRQAPDLKVSVGGPTKGKIGHPLTATITIKNHGSARAGKSLVWVAIPGGLTITDGDGATRVGSTLVYDVGRLAAGRTQSFVVKLNPKAAGKPTIHAAVATGDDHRYADNSTARKVAIRG